MVKNKHFRAQQICVRIPALPLAGCANFRKVLYEVPQGTSCKCKMGLIVESTSKSSFEDSVLWCMCVLSIEQAQSRDSMKSRSGTFEPHSSKEFEVAEK